MDPPPYQLIPQVSPIVSSHSAKPIKLFIPDTSCTYGTFLHGTIEINPRWTLRDAIVHITIFGREREGVYGNGAPSVLAAPVTNSRVALGTLAAGYRYSTPFSIQFPHKDWAQKCKCGRGHDPLPSSLLHGTEFNKSLTCESHYLVKVVVTGCEFSAFKYLNFKAISNFQSQQTLVYKSLKTLFGNTSLGFKKGRRRIAVGRPCGKLVAQIYPCYHSGYLSHSSEVSMRLLWVPRDLERPPALTQAHYRIVRLVYSSKSPLMDLTTPTFQRTMKNDILDINCHWIDCSANLSIRFDLKGLNDPLETNYTGCLTAVRYKMIITLKTVDIEFPLIINGIV